MSRLKERKEKNCLNCNAEVQGRYCQNCGQENTEPRETVWQLILHFFEDITHFDGKFFNTVKYLFLRPGFLSKEYMTGRRAAYVNPVRMYIFTSAFFFLIFFSFLKLHNNDITKGTTINDKTYAQVEKMDSLAFDAFTKDINKEDGKKEVAMTRAEFKNYYDSLVKRVNINFTSTKYRSKAHYDSLLRSGAEKHNWFKRQFIYKEIEINEKFKDRPGETFTSLGNILLHSLPQMFFISLPIFAFWLKLLYIRRKQFYYVDHIVFSIHFYNFIFIVMLVLFGLGKLNSELNWTVIRVIETIIGFGLFFYLYKAMRKFYQQRRAKTITKFLLLCILLAITILLLFITFLFYSFFKL